jgi:hypothetical protein
MSFTPLLDAAPAIPVHAFAAMTAFALGAIQLAARGRIMHAVVFGQQASHARCVFGDGKSLMQSRFQSRISGD